MPAENCSFVQFLRDRIIACKAFGLWMHAHAIQTDDRKLISNILFIDIDCFTREIKASSLTSDGGSRMLYNNFASLFGFETRFEKITPRIQSSNATKSVTLLMFQFLDPCSTQMLNTYQQLLRIQRENLPSNFRRSHGYKCRSNFFMHLYFNDGNRMHEKM